MKAKELNCIVDSALGTIEQLFSTEVKKGTLDVIKEDLFENQVNIFFAVKGRASGYIVIGFTNETSYLCTKQMTMMDNPPAEMILSCLNELMSMILNNVNSSLSQNDIDFYLETPMLLKNGSTVSFNKPAVRLTTSGELGAISLLMAVYMKGKFK
jgi:CheY-specific phosphatase CheX